MIPKAENNIVILQETLSTNNYASSQLTGNEVKEGTVFLAHKQLGGRGQMNNSWESEAGKNLTFSLVLKPSFLDIIDQFMLSKVVTLGICSAVNGSVDGLKIKWPNDIYVGNHKLGGILIENSIQSGRIKYCVVGIGLNVNQEYFTSDAPNPMSLKQLTGKDFDIFVLLDEILLGINHYYQKLKNGYYEEINLLFHQSMYRLNETHQFECNDVLFSGTITGVNEIGQLMLTDQDGICKQFSFKEIEYVR